MNQRLWLDFETRSTVNLKDCGLDKYAKDNGTDVLMLAWAFDDEAPALWQPRLEPMPDRLFQGLINKEIKKCAWNYNFEKDVFEFRLGIAIPLEEWYDPSILCIYMSLPAKLDRAATALGIDIAMKKVHLVGKGNPKDVFCKPSKTTKTMLKKNPELAATYYKNWESHPELWQVFEDYCLQDVIAERAVWYAATAINSPMTYGEYEAWREDQEMNSRGVWIDQVFVNCAKKLAEDEANSIVAEMATLTGLENPNSQKQMVEWLQKQGYKSSSIDKENIENALNGTLFGSNKITPVGRQVLELKQKLGGSAYKKLESILDRMGADGRLRDQFVYHGAHTGRWSGRGVQLQNLFKPSSDVGAVAPQIIEAIKDGSLTKTRIKEIVVTYNDWVAAHPEKKKKPIQEFSVMAAIAGVIRTAFAATPGKKLLVGDLAQIESRVLAAIAGCKAMIDAYAQGHDLYKEFISWLMKKPIEEVTSAERARGKVVILGCGFSMGVDKFIEYAATFGITLSEKDAKEAVYGFREKYSEITSFWKEIDEKVKKAVKAGCRDYCRGLVIDGRNPKMLRIQLPSGRYLHYLNPHVTLEERFGRMQEGVSYEAWDSKGLQIKRLYGGLLTENVVQAIARDLLLNGMIVAEKRGMPVIMTIHDEIVSEVEDSPEDEHEKLLDCMRETPDWAEGMGFILAAEGYQSHYYKK